MLGRAWPRFCCYTISTKFCCFQVDMAKMRYFVFCLQLVFILTCTWTCATAHRVRFYSEKNYQGLELFESQQEDANCIQLPEGSRYLAESLKTNACILVHDNDDCDWHKNNSILIPAGAHPDLSVFAHSSVNFSKRIASYKECSDDTIGSGGGDSFLVEFKGYQLEDTYVYYANWPELCECTTLPEYMFGKVHGVHNYGNCVKLYSEKMYVGENVLIHGGVSAESRNLEVVGFDLLTKSFSVCDHSVICSRITEEAYETQLQKKSEDEHHSLIEDNCKEEGTILCSR